MCVPWVPTDGTPCVSIRIVAAGLRSAMNGNADRYLFGITTEAINYRKLDPFADLYVLLADHTSCGVADF